ncbi:lipopolysaccharide biosynthesis protein [Parvularcula lutaonensis]|uniref:Lipopolysaccharide biosynthesis protein n=1 Tax=Parvularcula lutaonensis TaxID=491923 RepID=A0ABV7M9V6_9PROT|nr:oligosaccharide flippase family protein [Parvularcula lutaonensis]GGY44418.1 hypothetical protein GCM10007148_11650 [Parvularcula lutaonensis]
MSTTTDISQRARALFASFKAVVDFAVLFLGQVVTKLAGIAAFAFLARTLTAEEYGAVETAVSMWMIGFAFVDFGTGATGIRRLSQHPESYAEIVRTVASARLMLAAIAVPLLLALYVSLAGDAAPPGLLLLYGLSLFGLVLNQEWLFQAKERMDIAAFGPSLRMGAFLVLVILFAPGESGVLSVGYAEALAAAIMALFFLASQAMTFGLGSARLDFRGGLHMIRSASGLGLAKIANAFASSVPVLIVAAIAGATEAGDIGAALRIAISIITFSWLYYLNLYPLFARHAASDREGFVALVEASQRFASWTGVVACAVLFVGSKLIMSVVFGADYADVSLEFEVLVVAIFFTFASGTARWTLIAQERNRAIFRVQLWGAVVTAIVALGGAITHGALGGAVGYTVGVAAVWSVAHLASQRESLAPTSLRHFFLPTALGVAVCAGVRISGLADLPAMILTGAILGAAALADPRMRRAMFHLAASKSGDA